MSSPLTKQSLTALPPFKMPVAKKKKEKEISLIAYYCLILSKQFDKKNHIKIIFSKVSVSNETRWDCFVLLSIHFKYNSLTSRTTILLFIV